MTLPAPNLDDRNFEQIFTDLVSLIPRYCPQWTDHNPSDPGITLLELFAWLAETLQYRMNQIPEKNYMSFLNLLGITLKGPEPARTVVRFTTAPTLTKPLDIQTLTAVSAQDSDGAPLLFETLDPLTHFPVRLECVASGSKGSLAEGTSLIGIPSGSPGDTSPMGGFPLFEGTLNVPRFVYPVMPALPLCQLGDIGLEVQFQSHFKDKESSDTLRHCTLSHRVSWQAWNGTHWFELPHSLIPGSKDGCLLQPPPMAFESEENPPEEEELDEGDTKSWPIGSLRFYPHFFESEQQDICITEMSYSFYTKGSGTIPRGLISSVSAQQSFVIDPTRIFAPFGDHPLSDSCFYVNLDGAKVPGAILKFGFTLAPSNLKDPPGPTPDLSLVWEYWAGREWAILGRSTVAGVTSPWGSFQFYDSTCCFCRDGEIRFEVPENLSIIDVDGSENHWVRARIQQGHYGTRAQWELQGEAWNATAELPLRPPYSMGFRLHLQFPFRPIKSLQVESDFELRDATEEFSQSGGLQPFLSLQDTVPTLWLGLDGMLSAGTLQLWLEFEPESGDGAWPLGNASQGPNSDTPVRLFSWEVSTQNQGEFLPVAFADHTLGFSTSGIVALELPETVGKKVTLGKDLYWLRAKLLSGGFDRAPKLKSVIVNAVEVLQGETFVDEIIGKSQGLPDETYTLKHKPVLVSHVEIVVREGVREIPYLVVPSFALSGPQDCHVMVDANTGVVRFGDGSRGKIPPKSRSLDEATGLIVAKSYRSGGGKKGNLSPNSIQQVLHQLEFVDGVEQPMAAAGGQDPESLEEAKKRAALLLSLKERAVTAQDFEELTRSFSPQVGDVKCLSSHTTGMVTLCVIPKSGYSIHPNPQILSPHLHLLKRVHDYLSDKCCINTSLQVIGPKYKTIKVLLTLRCKMGLSGAVLKDQILSSIRKWVHPLTGGPKGTGLPPGTRLLTSHVALVLEGMPQIIEVQQILFEDVATRRQWRKVECEPFELLHVESVQVLWSERPVHWEDSP